MMTWRHLLSSCMLCPSQNRPALKKYGDMRPDFNLKEPNWRTFLPTAKAMNSFWYGSSVASLMTLCSSSSYNAVDEREKYVKVI